VRRPLSLLPPHPPRHSNAGGVAESARRLSHGDTGEIEYRHDGGYTYIYLSYADTPNSASIRLEGTYNLTAADFVL